MKLFFPTLLSLSLMAFAAEGASTHMVGDIPMAEHGLCLGLAKGRRGSAEQQTNERIAAVMKRLRLMKLDGRRYLDPLKFNLVTSGRSNQFGGSRLTLSMLRLDQYGNPSAYPVSTGTVAHEIGHWIGHTMDIRGKTAYENFRTSAFRACHGFVAYTSRFRDGRSHHNDLNETFAEVFSAYVTAPNFLKKACPAGYDFMRDQVFRGELSQCPAPLKKPNIPLPRARPAGAPQRTPVPPPAVAPAAADGEHPISNPPMPRVSPVNPGQEAAPQ